MARARAEFERVADRVFILVPGHSFWATFHNEHCLWVDRATAGYDVIDRTTGERRFLPVRDPQPVTPSLAPDA